MLRKRVRTDIVGYSRGRDSADAGGNHVFAAVSAAGNLLAGIPVPIGSHRAALKDPGSRSTGEGEESALGGPGVAASVATGVSVPHQSAGQSVGAASSDAESRLTENVPVSETHRMGTVPSACASIQRARSTARQSGGALPRVTGSGLTVLASGAEAASSGNTRASCAPVTLGRDVLERMFSLVPEPLRRHLEHLRQLRSRGELSFETLSGGGQESSDLVPPKGTDACWDTCSRLVVLRRESSRVQSK